MSRIGKLPVKIPSGVVVTVAGNVVDVKGPKGALSFAFPDEISVEEKEGIVFVSRLSDDRRVRAFHGLVRAVIFNMVQGVTKGHEKSLEIVGVGYRAKATGSSIELSLGFSHPVSLVAPEGVSVVMHDKEKNVIVVSGIDKQKVGEFAANIRKLKKPEPYKGKGIRYVGEYVRRKAGKSAAK
jgi:large subunit ribosomal protein L6